MRRLWLRRVVVAVVLVTVVVAVAVALWHNRMSALTVAVVGVMKEAAGAAFVVTEVPNLAAFLLLR